MSISLTDSARDRVLHFLADSDRVGLRVSVRQMGCSGWAYTLDLAERVTDDDVVFEDNGLRIVVEREALPIVSGSEIDFVTEGLNRSFKVRNPNATGECGCGESFTVN